MSVFLSPVGGAGAQFFDNNGNPLTGGKLYTYSAGTTTPQATYTSAAGLTSHTNPIVLDAAGRVPNGGEIWLTNSVAYKFVLKTSADVLLATLDNIFGNGDPAFSEYTPATTSLLAPGPLTVKAAFDQITNEDSGASVIGYLPPFADAVATTVAAKLQQTVSVKDFGAVGDGVTDNKQAFTDALTSALTAFVPEGTFAITSGRVGELQIQPRQLYGLGTPSTILVDNSDEAGFRIGAVGGGPSFGGSRVITKFSNLNFTCRDKSAGPAVATAAIDAQSVNPIVIENTRFFGFGPEALRLRRLYYGNVQGGYFVKSGIKLSNINHLRFSDCDVFGGDTSLPSNATLFGSAYPVEIFYDDPLGGALSVKFESTTFEAWDIPVFKFQRAYNIIFDAGWFEALTGAHIFKLEQCRFITLNDCLWDLAYTGSGVLFHIDDSGPIAGVKQTTLISVQGGNFRAQNSITVSEKFVSVANGEEARVLIDSLTFSRGHLFADPTVDFDVRSIFLATADQKSFYSLPNALMTLDRNSWMPESLSSDWDFAAGANFAVYGGTVGLTIATTTTVGEYITGSRGVKVTGFASDGTKRQFARNCGTNGDMGPVTVEGQTYIFFLRVKSSQDVTFQLSVNGGFVDFSSNVEHTLPAGQWRDYVFKSAIDDTWVQGRFFNPSVIVSVTNNSGSAAEIYLDRVDYQIVDGDFAI